MFRFALVVLFGGVVGGCAAFKLATNGMVYTPHGLKPQHCVRQVPHGSIVTVTEVGFRDQGHCVCVFVDVGTCVAVCWWLVCRYGEVPRPIRCEYANMLYFPVPLTALVGCRAADVC